MNKIKKLPGDTKIYCGHEYTYRNAEFCMKYDEDNISLKNGSKNKKLRSNNLPTIPAILDDELRTNIFLRCDQDDLKIKLNMETKKIIEFLEKLGT